MCDKTWASGGLSASQPYIFYCTCGYRLTCATSAKCIDLLKPPLFKLVSAKLFYPTLKTEARHRQWPCFQGPPERLPVGAPPTGTTSGSSPEMAEGSEELSVSTLRASFPTEPVRRAFTGSEGQLYRVHSLSPFKAQAPGRPCSSAGKESACNVEDLGSIPGLGRSPGEGKGYPLHHSCLENSMDCIVHGCKESDMTERLSLSGS